jgi:hypothetical protein
MNKFIKPFRLVIVAMSALSIAACNDASCSSSNVIKKVRAELKDDMPIDLLIQSLLSDHEIDWQLHNDAQYNKLRDAYLAIADEAKKYPKESEDYKKIMLSPRLTDAREKAEKYKIYYVKSVIEKYKNTPVIDFTKIIATEFDQSTKSGSCEAEALISIGKYKAIPHPVFYGYKTDSDGKTYVNADFMIDALKR